MLQLDTAFIGAVAGIVALIAYIPYFVAILRRQTKPNRATWWIWAIVDGLALESYQAVGATNTLWVPAVFFFGSLVVALMSLRYGEKGWHKLDKWCLGLASVSIVVRFVFKEPFFALCLNLFILMLGALPTIRKSWTDPAGEDKLAWTLFLVCCIINMFAIDKWNFEKAGLPIYALVTDIIIVVFLLLPRKKN